MAIIYKIDILEELNNIGYSTYKIRKEKILGESTIQKLRKNESISFDSLNAICCLLRLQPGDILEWTEDNKQ